METSQQVSDGDIVANLLHEMEPEAEQVDSDNDNEGTEADDARLYWQHQPVPPHCDPPEGFCTMK